MVVSSIYCYHGRVRVWATVVHFAIVCVQPRVDLVQVKVQVLVPRRYHIYVYLTQLKFEVIYREAKYNYNIYGFGEDCIDNIISYKLLA